MLHISIDNILGFTELLNLQLFILNKTTQLA